MGRRGSSQTSPPSPDEPVEASARFVGGFAPSLEDGPKMGCENGKLFFYGSLGKAMAGRKGANRFRVSEYGSSGGTLCRF